ncbi:MAG: hypothetical protein ABEH80_05755 [Halobaculum sp.]
MQSNTEAGFDIEADRERNVLYIDLSGRLDADAIREAADETVSAAETLRSGFDIVTDLRGFSPPSPDAAEPIGEAQQRVAELGVDRVVRVSDENTSSVVELAFERRSKEAGYSGETAESVEAAERRLGVAARTATFR